MDSIDYYDRYAVPYYEETVNLSMEEQLQSFMELLPENGEVLDLGCGSGRDTLFLEEEGFSVTAIQEGMFCIFVWRIWNLMMYSMESGHVPCWDTLRQIRFMKCWGKFWMP